MPKSGEKNKRGGAGRREEFA